MSSAMTVGEERYQVFLGGSCGGRKSPTTWRQEVAIPLLQQNQVKFFNPQVDAWSHDLIHKENSAKDNSEWLLFVLEASTRGIASMVEVAHLVGSRRPVVFVLQKEREAGKIDIPDDCVSSFEVDDIRRSQALLHTIIGKEQSSKYCSVLKDGLQHVINALKQQTGCSASVRGCSAANGREKRRRTSLREILNMLSSFSHKAAVHRASKPDRPPRPKLTLTIAPLSSVRQPASASWRSHRRALAIIGADGIDNIASLAEERLRQHGISSPVVLVEKDAALDLQALSESCVLLAFISSNFLSCTTMCKTAFMLAKHSEMVVCVQDMSSNSGNTTFSCGAVSDYNRGRSYLRDIASRNGATVVSDLDEALSTACRRAALVLTRPDSGNNNEVVLPSAVTCSANSPTDVRESFFGSSSSRKAGSSRKSGRSTSSGPAQCLANGSQIDCPSSASALPATVSSSAGAH